jgi:hypothetical protein
MHGDGIFPLGSGTIQEINVVQRLNPATILFVFEKCSFQEARGKDHLSVEPNQLSLLRILFPG